MVDERFSTILIFEKVMKNPGVRLVLMGVVGGWNAGDVKLFPPCGREWTV